MKRTVQFEWDGGALAWDDRGKRWLSKYGAPIKFEEIKLLPTTPDLARHPESVKNCLALVKQLLSVSDEGDGFARAPDTERGLKDVIYDFKGTLRRMGFPKHLEVFKQEGRDGQRLLREWIGPMPVWAAEQIAEGTSHRERLSTFLAATHPHAGVAAELARQLSHRRTVIELVAPPGALKGKVVQELVEHMERSGLRRPHVMWRPYPIADFFPRLARDLELGSIFDPGRIAEMVRDRGEAVNVVVLPSISEYLGPQLETHEHRVVVRNWCAGLETIRDIGGVSILLAHTIPLQHQAETHVDLSIPLVTAPEALGEQRWDTWIGSLREHWQKWSPASSPSWEDLSRTTRGQAKALVDYLERSHRAGISLPLSTLNESLAVTARDLLNRLPECCVKALKAVVKGSPNGAVCDQVLEKVGILRHQDGRLVPAVASWTASWLADWTRKRQARR